MTTVRIRTTWANNELLRSGRWSMFICFHGKGNDYVEVGLSDSTIHVVKFPTVSHSKYGVSAIAALELSKTNGVSVRNVMSPRGIGCGSFEFASGLVFSEFIIADKYPTAQAKEIVYIAAIRIEIIASTTNMEIPSLTMYRDFLERVSVSCDVVRKRWDSMRDMYMAKRFFPLEDSYVKVMMMSAVIPGGTVPPCCISAWTEPPIMTQHWIEKCIEATIREMYDVPKLPEQPERSAEPRNVAKYLGLLATILGRIVTRVSTNVYYEEDKKSNARIANTSNCETYCSYPDVFGSGDCEDTATLSLLAFKSFRALQSTPIKRNDAHARIGNFSKLYEPVLVCARCTNGSGPFYHVVAVLIRRDLLDAKLERSKTRIEEYYDCSDEFFELSPRTILLEGTAAVDPLIFNVKGYVDAQEVVIMKEQFEKLAKSLKMSMSLPCIYHEKNTDDFYTQALYAFVNARDDTNARQLFVIEKSSRGASSPLGTSFEKFMKFDDDVSLVPDGFKIERDRAMHIKYALNNLSPRSRSFSSWNERSIRSGSDSTPRRKIRNVSSRIPSAIYATASMVEAPDIQSLSERARQLNIPHSLTIIKYDPKHTVETNVVFY